VENDDSKEKAFTSGYGYEIPLIKARPREGAGIGIVVPDLLNWQDSHAVADLLAEPGKEANRG
jgi:type IV secretory pathway TraG/TraD family ATPase VirD4